MLASKIRALSPIERPANVPGKAAGDSNATRTGDEMEPELLPVAAISELNEKMADLSLSLSLTIITPTFK